MYYKITAVFFISLISIALLSCENPIDYQLNGYNTQVDRINWNKSNSVVCFGTSITNGKPFDFLFPEPVGYGGYQHTKPDSSYPKLLDKKLKIKVNNQGYWGAYIRDANDMLQDSVLSKNPALIILEFGANEFLRGYKVSYVEPQLDSLIKRIKTHKISIVLLSFFHPDMLNHISEDHFLLERSDLAKEYYNMFIRVAKANNIFFEEYILKGIWGQKHYMSDDGIHPNNAGNAKLAENIFYSLYKVFKINNMIR